MRPAALERAAGERVLVGRGQGLAIELAVGGEREGVAADEGGGQHVLGQDCASCVAQGLGVGAARRLGQHVRHEPLVAGAVLARDHHRVAHARARAQLRLDLAELDAEAADLDLRVVAPR
jgi:hypothetical protein